MKPEARLFVKRYDGNACGPFRWTTVREWVAIGYFTAADEVRLADEATWNPIGTMTELLVIPPGDELNDAVNYIRDRAREKKPVGPRAAAYLERLGCPVRLERLNPYTAFRWVQVMEELNPQLADARERWAAEEESKGQVPSDSADDATADQIAILRSLGRPVPQNLTRREARRLISGPPTAGQLRRLKFYGITLPEGACKDEAAELIDRQMRENWASEEAYQASRRRSDAKETEPQKLAAASEWPAPPPAVAKPASSPAARSVPPIESHKPQTVASPARRPIASLYVAIVGVVAIGIGVVAWSIAQRRPGADSTQSGPHSPKRGSEGATPEARLARTVTLLESPDKPLAEQLRTWAMSLELTGIIGGPEPRALIGGQMYRVGDVVDESRRVVIVQIDLNKNAVIFGDAAGNIVQRVLE